MFVEDYPTVELSSMQAAVLLHYMLLMGWSLARLCEFTLF